MGGFCHHEGGSQGGEWCGGLTCTNPETGAQVGYPQCCDIVAEGCGGIATPSSTSTSTNFGTGKPVGADVEIAIMNGADGEKTTLETAQAGAASGAQGLLLVVLLFGTIFWLTGLKKDRG